jgi:hypothetical protein
MTRSSRITAEEVGQSPDRPRARQAVVIIHGIGEPQPMNTLRDFIDGLYPPLSDGKPRAFSKPDRISETLDLRRMATGEKVTGNKTDFYELYWAHLMQGSTLAHVMDWFVMLLLRLPTDVPKRLFMIWLISWMIVGVGLGFAVYTAVTGSWKETLLSTGVLGLLLYAARGILRWFAIGYLGDAARYLRPAPENIGIRQAIRNAGLDVLRKLHDEPMQRYDRIILVGHSLGSVIAYDILTHLWQEMHWIHIKPDNPKQSCYDEMNYHLASTSGAVRDLDQFRRLQKDLLVEEQALGMPWKITDLITIGSPLTYADFLLTDRKYRMSRRKQDRELPTCPPQAEDQRDRGLLADRYKLPDGTWVEKEKAKRILHHAALFACTRWTNLFFHSDMIGGEVRSSFGAGVKDVPLTAQTLPGKTVLSHTMYWDIREPEACGALRRTLVLCEAQAGPHD